MHWRAPHLPRRRGSWTTEKKGASETTLGVRSHSHLSVNTHISVSLDGGADLLRAGCDGELRFALQAFIQSLLGHGGGAAHVFVAGVGAAADEPCGSREEHLMAGTKIKRESRAAGQRQPSIGNRFSPTFTSSGQPFFSAVAPTSDTGWARSGVKGPLMWGFSCTTQRPPRGHESQSVPNTPDYFI